MKPNELAGLTTASVDRSTTDRCSTLMRIGSDGITRCASATNSVLRSQIEMLNSVIPSLSNCPAFRDLLELCFTSCNAVRVAASDRAFRKKFKRPILVGQHRAGSDRARLSVERNIEMQPRGVFRLA